VLGVVLFELFEVLIADRHARQTLAGLLAAFGVARVPGYRWPRWLGTATLACVALVPAARAYHRSLLPTHEELEAEGEELYRCLEAFRERTGRWPGTFEEAGCSPRPNPFGGWRMEEAHGDACWLSVGEYRRDGLTLHRSPAHGWWVDS